MIEPTDEMLTAAFDACENPATEVEEADLRRMVAAVLALVERDRCMQAKGHVSHPLPKWLTGRGGSHPHFCVSCSDGKTQGPGCGNCRSTGFDQSPWPDCEQCRFARRVPAS